MLYAKGSGVEQDYNKAAYWFEKSAEQGDADACEVLAQFYEIGLGVGATLKRLAIGSTWLKVKSAAKAAALLSTLSSGNFKNS